jgi:hypothetical protein
MRHSKIVINFVQLVTKTWRVIGVVSGSDITSTPRTTVECSGVKKFQNIMKCQQHEEAATFGFDCNK